MPDVTWIYYSSSDAPAGGRGPWGPVFAGSEQEAKRIARARLQRDGLHLAYVERLVDAAASPRKERD